MDDFVLEKMKQYVAMAQNNTAVQERQIQELTDELEACRSFIESLQLKGRDELKAVSQFSLEQLKSGGEIIEQTKHQVDKGPNVLLEDTDGVHSVYRVLLSKCGPCPTPEIVDSAGGGVEVVDPAQTMCDIWEGLYNMEQENNRAERRLAVARRRYVRKTVCTAFGFCHVAQDTTLFRAACGFVEGSKEQCHECDNDETGGVSARSSTKQKEETADANGNIHVQRRGCSRTRKKGVAKETF